MLKRIVFGLLAGSIVIISILFLQGVLQGVLLIIVRQNVDKNNKLSYKIK